MSKVLLRQNWTSPLIFRSSTSCPFLRSPSLHNPGGAVGHVSFTTLGSPTPPPGDTLNRKTTSASSMRSLGNIFDQPLFKKPPPQEEPQEIYPSRNAFTPSVSQRPYTLHVYSTPHNTHITLSRPNCTPAISLSTGNLGFRKGGRDSYDAAFQLTAYVIKRIQDQGLLMKMRKLEVVFRGFGLGREAVTKALMSSEGKNLRDRVIAIKDATRVKFGGARSKKPRRLG